MIRQVHIDDAKSLLEIYNYFVSNSVVTFDIEPLSLDAFENKMAHIIAEYPFLVFEESNELLGYAYGSRFRPKPAYKNTVETTVYVKNGLHGKQIGTQLYKELLQLLKKQNLHVALGVLTLPNDASVKLHEKFNFKLVGHFKEVGFKFGKWLDVGVYQLNL
ncbi:N-acetyltransferase family protein [Flavobacteriaceae bacterium SZ-1-7]|uniref:GNAT family N-acetyltransferase n=1 Tax=Tamlana sedimenti TaxID=3134126 RepID=UPI003125C1B1